MKSNLLSDPEKGMSSVSTTCSTNSDGAQMSQVNLQWDDISFFVPAKRHEAQAASKLGIKDASFTWMISGKATGKPMKQILFKSSGHVQPGETVAIMGPSGSGKTSLLNVLAGRMNLSRGSKFEGNITINGKNLAKEEFGKLASFVEQDDFLISTMTVRELFEFAIQITTYHTPTECTQKVDELIHRLGLSSCQHTLVGNASIKGLSGGERKRASIGYELITNPSLLFLDEPTSGLDSNIAYKIIQLLNSEAERGMTILATIH